MALKRKIDKATFDALPADVQKEYKAEGMDYVLDVEGGIEDPAELKRAKDREKQRADEEKKRADALQKEKDDAAAANGDDATAAARKAGDIATLEKAWKKKEDDAKAAGDKQAETLRASLQRTLIDGTAASMAAALSAPPNVLVPHIKSRLSIDFTGPEPVLRVVGADGKPTALTVEELQQEFVANADFAAIITGSKANGGGAPGGKQGGGGASKKLSEMNDAERTAYAKANPTAFEKEAAAAKTVRI